MEFLCIIKKMQKINQIRTMVLQLKAKILNKPILLIIVKA